MGLSLDEVRSHFPALLLHDGQQPRIYLDNPGGTQVPREVTERIQHYLIHANANHGGYFRTSIDSDRILQQAHEAMADFLNASSSQEIIFGPNMTTLTFAISRSLAHWFKKGEEIILTRMDHDANVLPWVKIAEDHQLKIKWLSFNTETFEYDPDEFRKLLKGPVRLAAVNYASNAIGTINDIKTITRLAHEAGALVFVDAVQYVPHGPTDVQDLDCDFLVCSPYKFFGPHQGVLFGRKELLEELPAYKVRPAENTPPGKFETGTQSHEGQAGTLGALEYLDRIGKEMAVEHHPRPGKYSERRRNLYAAMLAVKEYETRLSEYLIEGLKRIPGIKIYGITDTGRLQKRVPTVSFTFKNHSPEKLARILADQNIFCWHGDFYAVEVVRHLGLHKKGGLLRVGAVHYNTFEEIDRLLLTLSQI